MRALVNTPSHSGHGGELGVASRLVRFNASKPEPMLCDSICWIFFVWVYVFFKNMWAHVIFAGK